jgi:hypothetical protein
MAAQDFEIGGKASALADAASVDGRRPWRQQKKAKEKGIPYFRGSKLGSY